MTEVRMKNANGILFVVMVFLILGLLVSTGCAKKEGEAQAEKIEMEEPKPLKQEVELPAAVAEAVETNTPGAEIDFVEVAEEAGITVYDIEFKANRGEIEVAEDGTVIDVVTVVTMEEIPEAAAKAIKEAIGDAKILRMERAEVRTEIDAQGNITEPLKWDTSG
jgi:3D (Asp-Asp-Asp) domain-containing protein